MKKDLIYRAHQEHPEWCGAEIARHIGVSQCFVSKVARDLELNLPRGTKARRAAAQTVMKLGWAAVAAGLSIEDIEQAARAKRMAA